MSTANLKSSHLLGFIVILAGCSDRPGRERFPGPQGRTTDMSQVEATKAVMGGLDPSKNLARVEENRPTKSSKVSGEVSLSKNAKVRPGMIFFIAAKSLAGGPPLAVKRLEAPQFPYRFELSERDAMIPGRVLEGKMMITARLKKSPDPLAQDEGDLFGQVEAEVGQSNLKITLE